MPIDRSQLRFPLLAAFGALAIGCATDPPPRPVMIDPSNPAAPESASLAIGSLTQPSPAPKAVDTEQGERQAEQPASAPAHGHEHGSDIAPETAKSAGDQRGAAQKAIVYTCPMHPEVISDKPGRCPKCGMKLVPKEPAAPERKK